MAIKPDPAGGLAGRATPIPGAVASAGVAGGTPQSASLSFITASVSLLQIHWLPHSLNPVYAGVRLRCLIPHAVLAGQGHASRILTPGQDMPRGGVVVVQAKWLLDAGTPHALRQRAAQLGNAINAGARLVLDSFDNYFLNESGDTSRAGLLAAYREALPLFRAFTVSSPGLKPLLEQSLPAGGAVWVVGDPIETQRSHHVYESAAQRLQPLRWPAQWQAWRDQARLRLGRGQVRQLMWFGNHGSAYAAGGMSELQRLLPALEALAREQALQLTVVSNSRQRYEELLGGARFAHAYREWDRLHFLPLLALQDLVLLPARLTAFATAKSNNRMLLALAQGVPVMTDPLPDYLPWQDFCAMDDWDRLAGHVRDPAPLARRAAAAIPEIHRQYSPQAIAHGWLAALRQVATA